MKQVNEAYDPKYLVCVTSDNHNKFWRAVPDPDQNGFTATWGRIGSEGQSKHYPIHKYWDKYYEKLRKGYVDQTDLVKDAVAATSGEDGFKAIADKDVNELVKALRKYASETIKQNYTISQNAVTQQMLDQAKELIDKLNSIVDIFNKPSNDIYYHPKEYFNEKLVELFKTIPRKMTKVNDYLLKYADANDAAKIVDREQKLYDVLLANFQTQQAAAASASQSNQSTSTETILEKFGLECQVVDDQAKVKEIKDTLGDVASKVKRVFVVVNKHTQDKYKTFMAANSNCKTSLFFHGSKNENFWSILKNGLQLNPKATVTGKMLGNGIYFAPSASKSYGYVSLSGTRWAHGTSNIGYMAVFAVAIDKDNMYTLDASSRTSQVSGMDWDKLQKVQPGATCTYAKKGAFGWLLADELCIYREDQCTIRYIIELTI